MTISPLERITNHPGQAHGIDLFLKRDDLCHPLIQGNKWRKLRYVLDQVKQEKIPGIISFGGPFSNHLQALAQAGQFFDIQIVGIIRGLAADASNPTLSEAVSAGMKIYPVSKKAYNEGMDSAEIRSVLQLFPDYLILPEGGAGPLAVKGCADIATEICAQLSDSDRPLLVAVPAGTGSTAAGIVAGLQGRGVVWVFPATLDRFGGENLGQWLPVAAWATDFEIKTDYVFGGFASPDLRLLEFAQAFKQETDILLDPVYTVKMMYGLYDLMRKGAIAAGTRIVAVHTGGLQGWNGFAKRFGWEIPR